MSTDFADRHFDGYRRPEHSKETDPNEIRGKMSAGWTVESIKKLVEGAKQKGLLVCANRTTPGNQWKRDTVKISKSDRSAIAEKIEHQRAIESDVKANLPTWN